MRKSIKIILLLLAGIIITLGAVSGFIIATFDSHDYREKLIALVNSTTDYQLEIIEPFTADISMRPSFSVAAVKIIIPDNPKPLQISNLKLKLLPATLIHGELQMQVAGVIADPDSLKLLLPEELYVVDSITLAAQIVADGSELKFADLKLKVANDQGLEIDISGAGLIEDFSAPQPFAELDLRLKISAPDSRSLKGYLPDNLPELGQVRGHLNLVAVSDQDLAARKINLTFDRADNGLKTTVTGEIARIPVDPDTPNSGIDLNLELRSPDTGTISKLLRQPLPEIGPLQVKTRFRGNKKEFAIENLEFHAGSSGALEIKSSGSLSFTDSGTDPALNLKQIDLTFAASAPAGTRLPTFSKTAGNNFKVPDSGPLTMTLKLSGDRKKIALNDFSATFGKTAIKADLEIILTGKRPYLTGKISSRTVHFHDIIVSLRDDSEKQSTTPQNLSKQKKPAAAKTDKTPLLSRQPIPRDWLHQIDCDIDLNIDEITGLQKGLHDLRFGLQLEEGKLRVDPAAFVFEGGHAKFSLLIDDRNSATLPEIELKADVDDLGLKGLMEFLGLDSKISGKLTAHTELKSRGLSLHELATNLDGPFDVVLEEGLIPSQYLKLIAVDFLGWSFDQLLLQNRYAEISCGILALDAKKGLLTCKAFILESPNLIITGAGTLNLETETCDLTLYPKKKRKFWALVTPVNINGPIQDPQVVSIPVTTAALLYGGALLAPQFFLPAIGLNYLWEKVSKDKEGVKSPCFEYLQQHQ